MKFPEMLTGVQHIGVPIKPATPDVTPQVTEILDFDPEALFTRLGLREHLTPQRSNGFYSMVERIRADARAALQDASAA